MDFKSSGLLATILCIAPFFNPNLAFAQEDICGPALSSSLKGLIVKYSSYSVADQLKWEYSGKSWDSLSEEEQSSFILTYDTLGLDFGQSGSSDKEKYDEFIAKYEAKTNRAGEEAIQVSNVHDGLIREWGKCIDATRNDLFIKFDPATSQKHITVQVQAKTESPLELQGASTYNMTCNHDGVPFVEDTKMELHTRVITISCVRTSSQYEIGGLLTEYYPDASVTIKTSGGSGRFEFVSMVDGPAMSKFDSIDKIIGDNYIYAVNQFNSTNTSIERLRSVLGTWGGSVTVGQYIGAPRGGSTSSTCASGSYMIGVEISEAAGDHCDGCVAGLKPVCRPLNR